MAYNSDDIYISRAFINKAGLGGLSGTTITVTPANSPYTVTNNVVILGQGTVTVQLQANTGLDNQIVIVQNNTGTGNVTILPGTGQTVAGGASAVLTTLGSTVMYVLNGTNWDTLFSVGGGVGGDVTGPASSTDLAVVRFDGITGKLIQNSVTTISDTGTIAYVPSNIKTPATATITTANATPTNIITIATASNTNYACKALISCFSATDNTSTGLIDCVFKVKNIAGVVTASAIGPIDVIADAPIAAITAAIGITGTNFNLQVVGIAATNIRWNATLEYITQA